MKCNLCGCPEFLDMNSRKNVRCRDCGSLERTRLLWLYLRRMHIDGSTRILHLAPEEGLYRALSRMTGPDNYVAADFDPGRYSFAKDCRRIDLCDLDDWPSYEFDFIIHSHVLEHVPCNIAYSLFHLHRMLKSDGKHVCIVPIMGGKYDECFQDIGDAERTRRFGQYDHVRRFGRDDITSHLGKLLKLPAEFDAAKDFSEQVLRETNIPKNHWRGFHIGTVLVLDRPDMKFLQHPAVRF